MLQWRCAVSSQAPNLSLLLLVKRVHDPDRPLFPAPSWWRRWNRPPKSAPSKLPTVLFSYVSPPQALGVRFLGRFVSDCRTGDVVDVQFNEHRLQAGRNAPLNGAALTESRKRNRDVPAAVSANSQRCLHLITRVDFQKAENGFMARRRGSLPGRATRSILRNPADPPLVPDRSPGGICRRCSPGTPVPRTGRPPGREAVSPPKACRRCRGRRP
jgi:hypothetical protein